MVRRSVVGGMASSNGAKVETRRGSVANCAFVSGIDFKRAVVVKAEGRRRIRPRIPDWRK